MEKIIFSDFIWYVSADISLLDRVLIGSHEARIHGVFLFELVVVVRQSIYYLIDFPAIRLGFVLHSEL